MRQFVNLLIICFLLASCSIPTVPLTVDCAQPDVICVGMVTAYGKVDDHGMNQLAWEGVQKALAEGLIQKADGIETVDSRDRAKNIATFAEAGYNIIVTVSYAMGDETRFAADEWPEIRFIGVDQPLGDELEPRANLTGITFPEDQGGFLAGMLAAYATQTKKVGALCESQSILEEWRYCEGFRAGALYVNPGLSLRILYHPDHSFDEWFNDPDWGVMQISGMKNFGADILFATGGNTALGALQAASANGINIIGAEEDVYYQVDSQHYALSSAVKRADLGVYDLIRLAVAGTFPGGEYVGQYALAPFHDLESLVLPSVRPLLEGAERDLAYGTLMTEVSREP